MWSLIGQDRSVSFLQQGLSGGRLANSYLFTGPPRIGKMTLALELAKALNCLEEDAPCGRCDQCRRIAGGIYADVQVVGLEGHEPADGKEKALISIEQIRQLQHTASLTPYEGKHRVFILGQAEKLSASAANCLLKTLEEPPPRVVFVLLAEDEERLLQTVVSRCQQLRLQSVPRREIALALQNKGIEPGRAELLARLSRGRIGWALEASQDEGLLLKRQERVRELLDIIEGDLEQRFDYAARLAARFAEKRAFVWEELELWLDIWRDLLLSALGLEEELVNPDIKYRLGDMATVVRLAETRNFTGYLSRVRRQLELNAGPRLVLEVMMINMPQRTERVSGNA